MSFHVQRKTNTYIFLMLIHKITQNFTPVKKGTCGVTLNQCLSLFLMMLSVQCTGIEPQNFINKYLAILITHRCATLTTAAKMLPSIQMDHDSVYSTACHVIIYRMC